MISVAGLSGNGRVEMPEAVPVIYLDSSRADDFGSSWRFNGYIETLQAFDHGEVLPTLARVEKSAVDGFYAVGFIAYEAASGFNPDLPSYPPVEGLPLVWFAIFKERIEVHPHPVSPPEGDGIELEPEISLQHYIEAVARIKEYIACGDAYQVNYTFGMGGFFQGNPLALYRRISAAKGGSFNACIDTGRFSIISASPELFFSLRDGVIKTRPMKGTARRGRWREEDESQVATLKASPKERAENLMIVDLLRNDLGIVAITGSVKVESLFDIETYPTLHQMTSTVTARIRDGIGLAEILAALFPCGSVTGAPKRRSMEIIKELETSPRGVYCGAIGYVAPGGEALFSVAIRTLLFDKERQQLHLGIGSGITTDSDVAREYQECFTKSDFLFRTGEEFRLIESMRLENGKYPLLKRHLARLCGSAVFFGFNIVVDRITTELARHAEERTGVHKVRLILARDGDFTIASEPLTESAAPLKVAISRSRVDSGDVFRYHKTTHRELLDSSRAEQTDLDEVIFLNERGELTEGSYHNLLLKIDGKMLTPRRESGLLAGVMRQELLDSGEIVEATLFPTDLVRAEEIWLANSVRGMRRAVVVEGE